MRRSSTPAIAGVAALLVVGGGLLWWALDAQQSSSQRSEAAELAPEPEVEHDVALSADESRSESESEALSDEAELSDASRAAAAQAPEFVSDAATAGLPRARLAGVLVDASTRELVPHYLLRVHDRTHAEDLTTDDQGHFASTSEFLLGRVRVDPLDHAQRKGPQPSQQVELELAPNSAAARELELSVACGPTFFLDVAPKDAGGAFALADLRAELVLLDPDTSQRRRTDAEPLRGGDAPWVRFGPIAEPYTRSVALDLKSADGVWRGSAKVQEVRGVRPGSVAVHLNAASALAGHVIDATSGQPVSGAALSLATADDEKGPRSSARTDAAGAFRFEFVQPGTYELKVRQLRYTPQLSPVKLVSGRASTLDVTLALAPPAGSIKGEVTTVSGASTPKARIVLSGASGNDLGPPLRLDASWTTSDGRKVARFEFAQLPAGSYKLGVEKDDWLRWEGANQTCSPPREDVRILVHDDVVLCDYVVSAVDFDNGLALDGVHVWFAFKNGPQRERMGGARAVLERGVPIDRAFTWRADRAGYRSQSGDETSFVDMGAADGRPVRVLELSMKPGWGDVLRVVRADGKGPIAGVAVLADGQSVGTSAKDGTLRVELRDPPKSITIQDERWRLQGGVDLQPAWDRKDRTYVLLRLVPSGSRGKTAPQSAGSSTRRTPQRDK